MKLRALLLLGLAPLLAACDDDGATIAEPAGPRAYVRFVHAVPDTGVVDFRFVDRLENLPTFLGIPFRGVSGAGYVPVDPGTRPVRIFVNSLDPQVAKLRLVDTTITLQPNGRYTLVYAGHARGNADRLAVIDDLATFPSPAPQLALRTLNTISGGAATVTATPVGVDATTEPAAVFPDVPYLGLSEYRQVAARPAGSGNLYLFSVATDAASFTVTPNEPGTPTPAGQLYSPLPGMQIGGSVMTAVVVPGAVPGSVAATATNTTPSLIVLFDTPVAP